MNVEALEPRRHEPPPGWPGDVFERVTDALAAALVAAVRRALADQRATDDALILPAEQVEAGR